MQGLYISDPEGINIAVFAEDNIAACPQAISLIPKGSISLLTIFPRFTRERYFVLGRSDIPAFHTGAVFHICGEVGKKQKKKPKTAKTVFGLARRKGLEPLTYWFVEWLGSLNIALSYEFGGIVQTFWRTFYV